MAGSCHCPAQRHLLSLSLAVSVKFPVWRRGNCVNPGCQSSRYLQPLVLGWKTAYKHVEEEEGGGEEQTSGSVSNFKSVKKQNERLSNAESAQPVKDSKDHWFPNIRKVLDKLFKSHGEPWSVPWSAETTIQVVLLWIASFWFIGSWIFPFLALAAGFSKESLTYRGQALDSFLTDIVEGLAGIAVLHCCLARFRPLPSGWFRFTLKGNWQFDVVLGCLMFPLVNRLSQLNIDLVPMIPAPHIGVSSMEQSVLARDPVAMALYAVVVSICAPVWEEIVFRGFLLPSLTRYMPLCWAIIMHALAFALSLLLSSNSCLGFSSEVANRSDNKALMAAFFLPVAVRSGGTAPSTPGVAAAAETERGREERGIWKAECVGRTEPDGAVRELAEREKEEAEDEEEDMAMPSGNSYSDFNVFSQIPASLFKGNNPSKLQEIQTQFFLAPICLHSFSFVTTSMLSCPCSR